MAALALVAVDAADDLQILQVGADPDRRPDGAEGVEPLGAGELAVLLLQVAGGDVVGAGDAEDGVARLRGRGPREPVAQTTAISPSCSTRWLSGGSTIGAPGPISAEGALRKNSGSSGTALPSSLACSA